MDRPPTGPLPADTFSADTPPTDTFSADKPLADALPEQSSQRPEPKIDMELLRAGDPAHWRALVEYVSPIVEQLVRRWGKDPWHAEELAQKALVRIYVKRACYAGSGPFAAWASTVALNVFRAEHRLAKRDRTEPFADDHPPEEAPQEGPDPTRRSRREHRARVVGKAVERLGKRERDAIVARFLEDRSTADAARKLDVTEQIVRSRVQRGLKQLRRMEDVVELMLPAEA